MATQTIEVGANLDFDLLVSEAAPLASLIQRFGRVNRLGRWAPQRSLVIHAGFAHGEDDPIYGRATAATWRHLLDSAAGAPVESTWNLTGFELPPDAHLDLGLRPASALTDAASPDTRLAEPFVPTLLAAHVERWSRTSPAPWPDQDVGPFLHGVQYEAPTVSVAWRAMPPGLQSTVASRDHGDVDPVAAVWRAWLDVVRPTTWEFVDIPIWELRGLLSGAPTLDPTSDLEVTGQVGETASDFHQGGDVLGVVYGGPDEQPRLVLGPDDVRVGDRVILDAGVGGHDAWGWTGERKDPDDPPVPDIADLNPARRRATLRLSPTVLRSLVHPDRVEQLERMVGQLQDAEDQEPVQAALVEALPEVLDIPERAAERLRRVEQSDLMATGLTEHVRGEPFPIIILAVPELEGHEDIDVDQISDDDALSSSTTVRPQTLDAHGAEVGLLAQQLAQNLRLADRLCRAVATAGRWHDLGKVDRRFQVMLFDGDELAAGAAEQPRAKSGRSPTDPIARRAFWWSGLPTGFRHEAVSARLVDELLAASPELTEDLDADLVRHLVVSHHGHGRPLLPPLRDPDAPPVCVTVNGVEVKVDGVHQGDWGQPARFEALNARYGWWGLPLLETMVRMADMRCSEVAR